jgi:hypothetical protein
MNVVWSNRALRSLANVHHRISADSEDDANRTVNRILQRGDGLGTLQGKTLSPRFDVLHFRVESDALVHRRQRKLEGDLSKRNDGVAACIDFTNEA